LQIQPLVGVITNQALMWYGDNTNHKRKLLIWVFNWLCQLSAQLANKVQSYFARSVTKLVEKNGQTCKV